jgi:hypothetical protein
MAVMRRVNWISQEQVTVPDMRSIESASSNDWDMYVQAFLTGTSQGYVIRGFNLLMSGAIGNPAGALQMQVDPGAVLHIDASQSGTVLMVPPGTPSQVLNSATNTNVVGGFIPSSINFVTLDYTRYLDTATDVQEYIWDPSSNTQIPIVAPAAQIMTYVINISTANPPPNLLTIATVLTDSSNSVVSITDSRWLFNSLSTGGLTPSTSYSYPWTQGRVANPVTSTSDAVDPFSGGDKNIGSLKELINAILTTLKEIKGTPQWYSANPAVVTLPSIYQNAALNVLTGGYWFVPALGELELRGIATLTRFGIPAALTLDPFGPVIATEGSLTATVTDNNIVTFSTPTADTINVGDMISIGAASAYVLSVETPNLVVTVTEPGFTNGTYTSSVTLTHYAAFNLTVNQVLYILFPTTNTAVTYTYGQDGANPVNPQQVTGLTSTTITVPAGGNYITTGGNLMVHGQPFSYSIYAESGGVGTFSGVIPDPTSVVLVNDYVYQSDNAGVGYYMYSTPAAVPGIASGGVSLGAERVYWLAYYDGTSTIYLRNAQLSVGEGVASGDIISTSIMAYIGQPSQAISTPNYSSNIRGITAENLTARIGTLTDAIGDEQEDRSAYFYSTAPLTWNGTTATFTSNIVLYIVNSKAGGTTTHTISYLTPPYAGGTAGQITLTSGQIFYIEINRTATSETITGTIATSLPAQTQATKDIIPVFQNQGGNLILPFQKEEIVYGTSTVTFNFGQSFNQYAIVGNLEWATDNLYNIGGTSSGRPANIYVGTSIQIGGGPTLINSAGNLQISSAVQIGTSGASSPILSYTTPGGNNSLTLSGPTTPTNIYFQIGGTSGPTLYNNAGTLQLTAPGSATDAVSFYNGSTLLGQWVAAGGLQISSGPILSDSGGALLVNASLILGTSSGPTLFQNGSGDDLVIYSGVVNIGDTSGSTLNVYSSTTNNGTIQVGNATALGTINVGTSPEYTVIGASYANFINTGSEVEINSISINMYDGLHQLTLQAAPTCIVTASSADLTITAGTLTLGTATSNIILTYNNGATGATNIGSGYGWIQFPNLPGTTLSYSPVVIDIGGNLWYPSSSARSKKDIKDIEIDTSKIYNMRPVSYTSKFPHDGNKRQFGLIAEEVYEHIPDLVPVKKYEGEKVETPFGVNYQMLSVLLLAEMKKLKARIEELEK